MIYVRHITVAKFRDAPMLGFKSEDELRAIMGKFYTLENYDQVAAIDTDDLDEACRLSNNTDSPWVYNDKVSPRASLLINGVCRSTSVGDVLIKDGKHYVVASCGFVEIL